MRVRAAAPGTRANNLDSLWNRRVSKKGPTIDQLRILIGTLKTILRDEEDRITNTTTEIARGVRRRRRRH